MKLTEKNNNIETLHFHGFINSFNALNWFIFLPAWPAFVRPVGVKQSLGWWVGEVGNLWTSKKVLLQIYPPEYFNQRWRMIIFTEVLRSKSATEHVFATKGWYHLIKAEVS